MLPRRHRLTSPADYRAVLRGDGRRRRRRAGTDLLVVHLALPEDPEPAAVQPLTTTPPTHPPRVGFVVSRAVGNSVVRHRVVRRLRAQVAERTPRLPAGADLVVRARPEAALASSAQLGSDLDHALERVLRPAGAGR